MPDKSAAKMVNSTIIAQLFGVTTRRVQQLTQEGVIQATKAGGANKYDLLSTIQQYIKYLTEKANGRELKKDRGSKAASLRPRQT